MFLDIEDWKRVCKQSIYEDWASLEWPNGIGIAYEEAGEFAERVLGQGPVVVGFDRDEFYDCLCELEEDIADMNGHEKTMDW